MSAGSSLIGIGVKRLHGRTAQRCILQFTGCSAQHSKAVMYHQQRRRRYRINTHKNVQQQPFLSRKSVSG